MIVCLINNTSLIDTPDTLKVFKPEDTLVLDHILKEVRAGKEIRQILSETIVQEKRSSADSANDVLPSELCLGCNRRRHIDKGKHFKISMVTDLSSGKFCFPIFICDYCINTHGAPKEINHGKVVWKSQQEFVQEEKPAPDVVEAEVQH